MWGREQGRKRIAVPVTSEGKEVTQREPEKGKRSTGATMKGLTASLAIKNHLFFIAET